jgi:Protein phosphatase 2C
MPAAGTAAGPAPGRGGWRVLLASERGAAHQELGQPSQDAGQTCRAGARLSVTALADGHGHHRHFRSGRGAQFAVTAACQTARALAPWLDALARSGPAEGEVRGVLLPGIVSRWQEAVRADAGAEPFTAPELALRASGDDVLAAYGTTLLLAVAGADWLVLAQLGDGDIVGIGPDGSAVPLIAADPLLTGDQTTSLCQPDAGAAFRVAVVPAPRTALLGVLMATDGFGNAQAADHWEAAVCGDLARLITGRGADWLGRQLPGWAAQCASAAGSADDTTVALLLAPAAGAGRAPTAVVAR